MSLTRSVGHPPYGKGKESVGMASDIFTNRARGLIYVIAKSAPRRYHSRQHSGKLTGPDLISSHNYGPTPAPSAVNHECRTQSALSAAFPYLRYYLPRSHQGRGRRIHAGGWSAKPCMVSCFWLRLWRLASNRCLTPIIDYQLTLGSLADPVGP